MAAQVKAHFLVIRLFLFIVTGIACLTLLINGVLYTLVDTSSNTTVSSGNIFCILLIVMAIIVPTVSFKKLINLGATRTEYHWGAVGFYAIWAAGIAAFNVLWLGLEEHVINDYIRTYNILDIFHWNDFGYIGNLLYQFAAYMMAVSLFHFLFSGVRNYIGWIIGALLIAAIPVSLSIESLRDKVADGFSFLLFNDVLWEGLALNLALACLFVMGSWLYTRKRAL